MTSNLHQTERKLFELPEADINEPRAKQSVLAIFKLSKETASALSVVSSQLGVKQKSLFDQLVADTEALALIARELRKGKPGRGDGIQNTLMTSWPRP